MRHSDGLVLAGHIDHQLGDQRPTQCGGQGIFALVHGAGHKGGPNETIDKQVAGVDRHGVHGAGCHGLLFDLVNILALAQVDSERNDVQVVLFANPGHHHGSIQTATVSQDDLIAGHCKSLILDDSTGAPRTMLFR